MNFFIDTHAHIYAEDFKDDRHDMIMRSEQHGIGRILMPNVDHRSIDGMLELEDRYRGTCFAMMGLHPCSVKKDFQRELYIVEDWLRKRSFIAVGEIGTDLYWDKSFFEQQKEAFTIQVNWAKEYNIPVVIHCRESVDQTIDLVESLAEEKLTGVFHCFTGTAEQAKRITALGFYIGIGGVATFKNGGLDKVLPTIAQDKLVLETDSPYLAPVPHRGKRNEPAYLQIIAEKAASCLGKTVEEIQQQTTQNALTLFNIK